MPKQSSPGNWPAPVFTNAHGQNWSPGWLGADKALYQPKNWHASTDIRVHGLRQIYIWPLAAQFGPDCADHAQAMRRFADGLVAPWQEIPDLLDHLNPGPPVDDAALTPDQRQDKIHRYGEFVYFYDFVQKILFRKEMTTGTPVIRLFRRLKVDSLKATIGTTAYVASVHRASLYVIESGAAALVVELDFGTAPIVHKDGQPQRMMLADAQDFISTARRSYTPYFEMNGSTVQPGGMAAQWTWQDEWSNPLFATSQPGTLAAGFDEIHKSRRPRLAQHWLDVLEPLVMSSSESQNGVTWRHFADERIPLMSFVSLTGASNKLVAGAPVRAGQAGEWGSKDLAAQMDLSLVSRGDWARLCYADGSGNNPMPYAPGIFRDFEASACYDRYFPNDANSMCSSRYLLVGYHFAAVGAGNYFDTEIVHHFRRHYFQIGLVVTMELAAMLALSGRVSDAVRQQREQGDANAVRLFREKMLDIQRSFHELTHLYVFRGLSNQLQPTEMYGKWRKALDLDTIYDDLENEVRAANDFIAAQRQGEQADAANRLATIATFGVVFGLWLALCQVIFAAQAAFPHIAGLVHRIKGEPPNSLTARGALGAVMLALVVTTGVALWLLKAGALRHLRPGEVDGWNGSSHDVLLRGKLKQIFWCSVVASVLLVGLKLIDHGMGR